MSRKNKNINNIPTLEDALLDSMPEMVNAEDIREEFKENITDTTEPVVEPEPVKTVEPVIEEVKEEKPPVKEVTPTISNPIPIKNEEKKENKVQPSIVGNIFTKGKLVKLTNIPVYTGPMTLYPNKYLSGNYFIYDGVERAKRYRICASRKDCGKGTKYIVGYIEKKYLK